MSSNSIQGAIPMPMIQRRLPAKLPAVLLAAGKGTRLAPLTHTVPKCLVPIAGRPLLDYWLETCLESGMNPVIVNTHHLERAVTDYLARSPWRDQVVLSHEDHLLGTGGTLLAQRRVLEHGPFFVAHADNLSIFQMVDFFAAHMCRPEDCLLTMMLFSTPTPQSCGIVVVDEFGVVVGFHEKSSQVYGNLANGAVYIMEPEVFSLLEHCDHEQPDISLDLIPQCMGRIATFYNKKYHRDIGTPESYAAAQHEIRKCFGKSIHCGKR